MKAQEEIVQEFKCFFQFDDLFLTGSCKKDNQLHDKKLFLLHNHSWGSSLWRVTSALSVVEILNEQHGASITDWSYRAEGDMIAGVISISGACWLLFCCYVVFSCPPLYNKLPILVLESDLGKERLKTNCSTVRFRRASGKGKQGLSHPKSEFVPCPMSMYIVQEDMIAIW